MCEVKAAKPFRSKRFGEGAKIDFYQPMKKAGLKNLYTEKLLNVQLCEVKAAKPFRSERFGEGAKIDFYQPMKKAGLKNLYTHDKSKERIS